MLTASVRDPTASAPRGLLTIAALVSGVVGLGLARAALLPGLGFWDTGEFQVVGPAMGTGHPTGFPAYVILGWLASIAFAPLGDPAFRMNLLSAVLVGGATALTVVLAGRLTGHMWIALATGIVMAGVPIVVGIGTHADLHALHLLLVPLLLILLMGWERCVRTQPGGVAAPSRAAGRLAQPGDRWLLAAAIVFGIGMANHTLTLLLAPGIGLFVIATQPAIFGRRRLIAGLAGAILLTAGAFYLELPLRAGLLRAPLVYGHPDRLDGFLYVILAQQFVGSLYQPFADLGGKVADLGRFGYDQLGLLVALVPVAFIVTVKREPRYALLTGVSFLITAWFASSYVNADISRYYLGPAVMAISWLALLAAELVDVLGRILGAESLGPPHGTMLSPKRTTWFGSAGPAALVLELGVAAALLVPTVQALPDTVRAADLGAQHEASDWAHAAMALMEPDSVIVSWWSYSTTLWYTQIIEGQRPDVLILDDRTRLDENLGDVTSVIDAQLGKRPIYLVRLADDDELAQIRDHYDLQAFQMPTEQLLLKVLGRKTP